MAPSYAASEPLAAPIFPPAPAEAFPAPIVGLAALEEALANGLMGQWRRLVEQDPLASFFQSPEWCVPWYRCYADACEPHVLVVRSASGIVGLVPMGVQHDTGELTFASNAMADYRDIVALPGYRAAVVTALVRYYLAGRFRHPLHIGWLDPASDTPALVRDVCDTAGLRYTARHQPCWRWFPAEGENLNKRFSRIRTHLNHFKRQGDVSFDRIATTDEWAGFREVFFRQHSLRQLQAGRPLSFHDPRKQRLYDMLSACPDVQLHVTAFRGGSRLLAGHVGVVWRNVLMLGAPSINIEEEQRSPAVILLAWIIQNAASQGLSGFDLTIGESEFKKRLGNQCVELTMMEIYGRRGPYYLQVARDGAVAAAKRTVELVGGDDVWKERIKPVAETVSGKLHRVAELGPRGSVVRTLDVVSEHIAGRRRGIVYRMLPDERREVTPILEPGRPIEIHQNAVSDLARRDHWEDEAARDIGLAVRRYGDCLKASRTMHTLLVDGRLAAWGYSYWPTEPATLTEIGDVKLHFEPRSVSLYDFHTLPEFRGRKLYQTLLAAILRQRFDEGAERAYITVLARNTPSRAAIERVGFRPVTINEARWLFKWRSIRSQPAPRAAQTAGR